MESSGKSLRLATTHLESGAEASAARCEQLAQVLSEDAHVVAGDLNIRDTELQGQNLQEWHDVWISSGQNVDHRFTWDTHHNSRLQAQQMIFFSINPAFDLIVSMCEIPLQSRFRSSSYSPRRFNERMPLIISRWWQHCDYVEQLLEMAFITAWRSCF